MSTSTSIPAASTSTSIPAAPSSSSQTAPAITAPAITAPATSAPTTCALGDCITNKKCHRRQCKWHCMASGGCSCPGHHPSLGAPPQDTSPRLSASFLNALSAAADIYAPRPSTIINEATTNEQKLRITHPHWFSSPTPSPARPSSLPIAFTLIDFAYDQKPAIVRAMHSSHWDWVSPGDRPYDTYSIQFSRWMPVEAAYSHSLRDHRRILIRSRGVTGSDEDVHIATLVAEIQVHENKLPSVAHAPPPPRPLRLPASPSQHRSLSSVSLAMGGKGKKRKIEEDLRDDEIIITGYKAPTPSRRRPPTHCLHPFLLHLATCTLPIVAWPKHIIHGWPKHAFVPSFGFLAHIPIFYPFTSSSRRSYHMEILVLTATPLLRRISY
ncbi:hypothetical protein B0H14DRAFT_2610257 [Mycena olivaceomarginata]|nr:hypothetical protein B0H14DRAFT_2610257 [Mycena olivaceomarginata]